MQVSASRHHGKRPKRIPATDLRVRDESPDAKLPGGGIEIRNLALVEHWPARRDDLPWRDAMRQCLGHDRAAKSNGSSALIQRILICVHLRAGNDVPHRSIGMSYGYDASLPTAWHSQPRIARIRLTSEILSM